MRTDNKTFRFTADSQRQVLEKLDYFISKGYRKVGKVARVVNEHNGMVQYIVKMEMEREVDQ